MEHLQSLLIYKWTLLQIKTFTYKKNPSVLFHSLSVPTYELHHSALDIHFIKVFGYQYCCWDNWSAARASSVFWNSHKKKWILWKIPLKNEKLWILKIFLNYVFFVVMSLNFFIKCTLYLCSNFSKILNIQYFCSGLPGNIYFLWFLLWWVL